MKLKLKASSGLLSGEPSLRSSVPSALNSANSKQSSLAAKIAVAKKTHGRQNDVDKVSMLERANEILSEELLVDVEESQGRKTVDMMLLDSIEADDNEDTESGKLLKSNRTIEVQDDPTHFSVTPTNQFNGT